MHDYLHGKMRLKHSEAFYFMDAVAAERKENAMGRTALAQGGEIRWSGGSAEGTDRAFD
jgi:hypothetical protein